MNPKFKVAANTLVQIIGRLISAGVAFMVTILVARAYGVEGYGEFTKIMTYTALFYLVADFGFNATVLKHITVKEEETENYFSSLLGLRLAISLVLIFLALAILNFLPYNSVSSQGFSPLVKLGVVIASGTILTQALFLTGNVIFQKKLRYDLSVLASSLGNILVLLLAFAFVSWGAPLWAVVGSYIGGGILMALLSLFFVRRTLPRLWFSFNLALWRKIFWQTLPLGVTLLFNLIYFRADMLLLSALRPNVEVGIYGLAYKFFEFPLSLVTFLMNSLYPVMLSYLQLGEEKFKNLIQKLSYFLLFSSLVLALVFIISAPLLTLVKADFAPSILTLRILSAFLPLFFLSSLFMWVLIALGKQSLLVPYYGLTMLLNIFLNIIFIPHYGYLAAAVTTGITEFFVLILTGMSAFLFLKKKYATEDLL